MNRLKFNERIKEIIRYYSLTSSTFADKIDVPKSSISHLMSGRNKPSLDFVIKITDKFPEVDLYWLLNGEGSFPKNKDKIENSNKVVPEKNHHETTATEENNLPKIAETPTLFTESKSNDTINFIDQVPKKVDKTKKLIKVILLYNDGSFDEFNK